MGIPADDAHYARDYVDLLAYQQPSLVAFGSEAAAELNQKYELVSPAK
jgi:hypothetical protein